MFSDLRQELAVKKPEDENTSETDPQSPKSPCSEKNSSGEKVDSLVQTDYIDSNKLMDEYIAAPQTPKCKIQLLLNPSSTMDKTKHKFDKRLSILSTCLNQCQYPH